eukprot:TRINITY_DN31184_c0_g1_i1.p1 TRINITY_DN31184_c0_g1~~TRINITY_DN31184_c0_g1_i1.p1  ORF type:complete len:972 (+),score=113.30 TRINITY_DN31184_c0_g1_i1:157-3072(+)
MFTDVHRALYATPTGPLQDAMAAPTWIREPVATRAAVPQPQSARSVSPLSGRSLGTSHHWQFAQSLPQRPVASGEPVFPSAGRIFAAHEPLSSPRSYRVQPWQNTPCLAAPPMVSLPCSLHTSMLSSSHNYPVSYEVPPATQRTRPRWDDCLRVPASNNSSPRASTPNIPSTWKGAAGERGFSSRRSNSSPVLPPEGPTIPLQPRPIPPARATLPHRAGAVSSHRGGAVSSKAEPMERAAARLFSSPAGYAQSSHISQTSVAYGPDSVPVSVSPRPVSPSVLWGETLHQPSARSQTEQQRPSGVLSTDRLHSPRTAKEPRATDAFREQCAPQIDPHDSSGVASAGTEAPWMSPKNSVWKRCFEGAKGEPLLYSKEKSAFVANGPAATSAGSKPLASDACDKAGAHKYSALPRLQIPSSSLAPLLRSSCERPLLSPSTSSLASGLATTAPNSERAVHNSPEVAEPEVRSQVPVDGEQRTAEAIFLGVMEAAGSATGALSRPRDPLHSLEEIEKSQPRVHSARSSASLHDVVGQFGTPPRLNEGGTLQQARPQDLPQGRMQHDLGIPDSFNKDSFQPHHGSSRPHSTSRLPAPDRYLQSGPTASLDLSCSREDAAEKARILPPTSSFSSTAACHLMPNPQDVEAVALAAAAVEDSANAVSMKALRELRSFRQPPAIVCQVVEAALTILGFSKLTWATSKLRLDSGFLQLIKSFTAKEAAQCPQGRVEKFFKLMQAPAFVDDDLHDKCPAAKPLASWCIALSGLLMRLRNQGSTLTSLGGRRTPEMGTSVAPEAGLLADRGVKQASSTQIAPLVPQARNSELDKQQRGSQRMAKEAPDFGGLLVDPPLWELDEEELSHVKDLLVGREDVGFVVFHGETDCRGFLQILPSILLVEHGEIVVYPDSTQKPPIGKGLNKPASVVLYGCMPKPRTKLTDSRAQERYKQRVAEMTEEKGAIFEDYDCNTGTWKFRVNHF